MEIAARPFFCILTRMNTNFDELKSDEIIFVTSICEFIRLPVGTTGAYRPKSMKFGGDPKGDRIVRF